MNRLTMKDKDGHVTQPLYTATTAAFHKLALYEDTGLEPEEIEELKKRCGLEGEWIAFTDESGKQRNKCSVCEEAIARNQQKSRFCPSCGAKLK
jgi:hypothetical protein